MVQLLPPTVSGNIVGAGHSLYAANDTRQMLSEGIGEGTPLTMSELQDQAGVENSPQEISGTCFAQCSSCGSG
jgi:hypothetical protein